ncbi:BREX protein BrxB domain-containing protein [Brachybacterium tyrofermentans]|uniref:BREX protein BrxB domain-containing protein n=1 Tax=Brachybacterium tyrofermentans TaxID=47848 RepID=UPI003FCF66A5
MLVYPPEIERQMRAQVPELELETRRTGHGWHLADLTNRLGRWVAEHEYADAFFEDPDDFTTAAADMFEEDLIDLLRTELSRAGDEDVVALLGVSSLYPYLRASHVIGAVDDAIRGRLLVLFPGTHDSAAHSYRLLNARDGFSYRAALISPKDSL